MANTNQFVITIKPMKGFVNIDFRELWRYRELLFVFTWKELKVRYKQTVLGALWAVFPPIVSMIIFSTFFGNFAQMPSDDIPYPIFVFTGLIFWNYFASSLTKLGNSMVSNQGMIQKIYFPRLLLPLSSILSGLVDFLIASAILIVLMVYYGMYPELIGLVLFPLLIILTMLSVLGIGLIFSAINVKYRDARFILPFIVRTGLFVTPVIYPLSIAEGKWKFILSMNPMTSVIENARTGLLGTGSIDWIMLMVSFVISFAIFIFGIYYFKSVEKYFADIV